MPTYGYHCPRCQTEFEVFQRMTDDPTADCPTCGAPGRRLFFPAGIVFKGSGFYKTDSRRASAATVPSGSGGGRSSGSNEGGGSAGSGGAAGSAGAEGSSGAGDTAGGSGKAKTSSAGDQGTTPAAAGG